MLPVAIQDSNLGSKQWERVFGPALGTRKNYQNCSPTGDTIVHITALHNSAREGCAFPLSCRDGTELANLLRLVTYRTGDIVVHITA